MHNSQCEHRSHSHLPCLQCHPQAYIRMVQHMIERCLLHHMSRDDCVKALSRHANIPYAVTLTVWRELLKVNKSFFLDYFQGVPPLASLWKAPVRETRLRRSHMIRQRHQQQLIVFNPVRSLIISQ